MPEPYWRVLRNRYRSDYRAWLRNSLLPQLWAWPVVGALATLAVAWSDWRWFQPSDPDFSWGDALRYAVTGGFGGLVIYVLILTGKLVGTMRSAQSQLWAASQTTVEEFRNAVARLQQELEQEKVELGHERARHMDSQRATGRADQRAAESYAESEQLRQQVTELEAERAATKSTLHASFKGDRAENYVGLTSMYGDEDDGADQYIGVILNLEDLVLENHSQAARCTVKRVCIRLLDGVELVGGPPPIVRECVELNVQIPPTEENKITARLQVVVRGTSFSLVPGSVKLMVETIGLGDFEFEIPERLYLERDHSLQQLLDHTPGAPRTKLADVAGLFTSEPDDDEET